MKLTMVLQLLMDHSLQPCPTSSISFALAFRHSRSKGGQGGGGFGCHGRSSFSCGLSFHLRRHETSWVPWVRKCCSFSLVDLSFSLFVSIICLLHVVLLYFLFLLQCLLPALLFCSVTCIWYVSVVVFVDVVFGFIGIAGKWWMQGWTCSKFWQCRVSRLQRQTIKENRRDAVFFPLSPLSLSLPLPWGIKISIQSIYTYIYIYIFIYIQIYSLLHAYSPAESFVVTVQPLIVMSIAVLEDAMKSGFFSSCHAPIFSRFPFWKANLPWIDPNKNPSCYELRGVNFLSGVELFFLRLKKPFIICICTWYDMSVYLQYILLYVYNLFF